LHHGSGASGFGCSSEMLTSGSGVRVHMCMCAYVHVCMCACVYIRICACVHVCTCQCVTNAVFDTDYWVQVCPMAGTCEDSLPYSFMALTLPRHHLYGLPQHTATLCNTLQPCPQNTATHCNTLQHCTSHRDSLMLLTLDITCCSVLQCVAVHCMF